LKKHFLTIKPPTMQIISLEVKNYKSLNDFSSNAFEFKTVNLIHGVNNSGKSNFLFFLHLIFQRKSIANEIIYIDNGVSRRRRETQEATSFWKGEIYDQPFIFSKDNRSNSIKYSVVVELEVSTLSIKEPLVAAGYIKAATTHIRLKINGEIISLNPLDSKFKLNEVLLDGSKIYSEDANGLSSFFETPAASKLKGDEGVFSGLINTLNDCTVFIDSNRAFRTEQFSFSQNQLTLSSSDRFKNWLYNLSLDSDSFEKYQKLVKFLDSFKVTETLAATVLKDNLKSFPFSKTKLSYSRFKDEIEVMLENDLGRYPLRNYGTGVQQILYVLARIFDTDTSSKILLIEELELNLSIEYQDLLLDNLKLFTENAVLGQVFCTSHSDHLLRSDFEVFEVKINHEGASQMKKSEYDEETKKVRRDMIPHVQAAGKEERKKAGLS